MGVLCSLHQRIISFLQQTYNFPGFWSPQVYSYHLATNTTVIFKQAMSLFPCVFYCTYLYAIRIAWINSCRQSTKHTHTHSYAQFTKHAVTESGNLSLHSEQSGKTQTELRGNQKESDLEIQGDQMVALLGVEAAGLGEMKARSVLSPTGQVRRDTQWERALRPGEAFTPSTKPSGVIPPHCLSILPH